MLNFAVVPLVGTWIEIIKDLSVSSRLYVVPLVGTWIEILIAIVATCILNVVPLVGTWIEIGLYGSGNGIHASFPSWERGLKFT